MNIVINTDKNMIPLVLPCSRARVSYILDNNGIFFTFYNGSALVISSRIVNTTFSL